MTVTLDQLLKDNPPLQVARPSERVGDVMERMREHDYSQLPVVADDATELRAIGLISNATIARTALYLEIPPSGLRVHHALDGHPIKMKLGDDLWRTLDQARQGEVLLVDDDDGVLRGILTREDFTTYLRQQSEDSLTVLDIEHTVKQLILEHYRDRDGELREVIERELGVFQRSLEKAVKGIVNRCLNAASAKFDQTVFVEAFQKQLPDNSSYEFDKLNFNQYQQILLGEACWAAYKDDFELPLEHLRSLLDLARELRNQIMHNRGLPTPAERARLIFCRELLSRVADRRSEVASGPAVVEPEPIHPPKPSNSETEVALPSEAEPKAEGPESAAGIWPSPVWTWLDKFFAHEDRVTLSFRAIEVVGGALPAAAREHRSWWTNDEEAPQSAQWLDAGWRVVSVNMTTEMVTFGRNTEREEACIAIFSALFRQLASSPEWTLPLPSPAGRTWQRLVNIGEDVKQAFIEVGFTKGDRFRISLYIDAPDPKISKALFDALVSRRDEIERSLGASLTWERNSHRRASRIALDYPRSISVHAGEAAIDELAAWVAQYVPRFTAAMRTS